MTDSERERLDRLAADLAASDPAWARQFSPTLTGPPPVHRGKVLVVVAGCAVLLIAGALTGTTALALLAFPVAGTPALLRLGTVLRARRTAARSNGNQAAADPPDDAR